VLAADESSTAFIEWNLALRGMVQRSLKIEDEALLQQMARLISTGNSSPRR